MAPFLRGLAALFLVLGEPAIPFDPFLDSPAVALAVAAAVSLLPLLVASPALPRWLRSLVPLAGFVVAVVGAGWVGLLERSGLAGAPIVGAGLLFGPYLIAEAALALSEYRLLPAEWKGGREGGAVDDARGVVLGVSMSIAPYVAFLLYVQLLHVLTGVAYWLDVFPSLALILAGSFLVLAFAAAPYVIPFLLGASPLPSGPLREALEEASREAGFRPREILRWRATGGAANAFVVGLLPGGQSVFLSDGLLAALSLEEVGAVFAHEMGHVRRGHFLILGGIVASFLLFSGGMEGSSFFEGWGAIGGLILPVVSLLGFWGLLFPWMSRRLERDADLYAAMRSSAMPRALLRVAAWNHIDLDRMGWRHFSIRRRLEELAWIDPRKGERHRTEFASIRAVAILLVLAGATLWGVGLPSEVAAGFGRHELAIGQLPQAERLLLDALRRRPSDRAAAFDLGRTFFFEGRLPEAVSRIAAVLAGGRGEAYHYARLSGDFWRLGLASIAATLAEEYRLRSLGSRGERRDLSRLLTAVQAGLARQS